MQSDLLSKKETNYRKGEGSETCGNCTKFVPPDSCSSVSGIIVSNALCDLFEPKQEENSMENLMSDLFGPNGEVASE